MPACIRQGSIPRVSMTGNDTTCPSPEPPHADGSRLATWLTRVCRFVLAAVFLMAAITKLTNLRGFQAQFLLASPLPDEPALLIAHWLPWLELTCGLCLVLGVAIREAALCVVILLFLFLTYRLLVPAEVDCRCFLFPSPALVDGPLWTTFRNGLLILCGLWQMHRT